MIETERETQKRLKIAKDISLQLENFVKGIYLGGSMGFGQNYSVTDKSDIDMVIVVDLDKINDLKNTIYFKGKIDEDVLELFKNKKINFFWVTKHVGGVEINTFIYETKAYIDFFLLKGGLTGYIHYKPQETQESYGFSGKIKFNRNVRPYSNGFLYERPALINNKFYEGVPRQDFLYSMYILYEKDNFLTNLDKEFWKKMVEKLVEEFGNNVDLKEFNILRTHYTYMENREKVPEEVIRKIKERTIRELKTIKQKIIKKEFG